MPNYTGTSASSTYTLESSGVASVVYSKDQSLIYVAKRDGTIDVFNTASHSLVTTWTIGTSLGGMSLSEDGTFLLATEEKLSDVTGSPAGPAILHRVSVATGAVQNYSFSYFGNNGYFHDVQIVDAHTAILSGNIGATFNIDAGTFNYYPQASNSDPLVRDGAYSLIADAGGSSGELFLYDSRSGTTIRGGADAAHNSGYNWGHQAISAAAGQVAQFIYGNSINLYDLALNPLRTVYISGLVDGLAYDKTGTYLYAHLIQTGVVAKYRVSDFALIDQITVGTVPWHNHIGAGDQIKISDDGSYIAVSDTNIDPNPTIGGKLQLIDLTARNEYFAGTTGADTFQGLDGNDTYLVNHDGDVVTETFANGNDTVLTTLNFYGLTANVENLTFVTSGSVTGFGNQLDNVIRAGSATAAVLNGGDGNDQIFGGNGNDNLNGGDGDDLIEGGEGNDGLNGGDGHNILRGQGGNDRFYLSTGFSGSSIDGGTGVDTLQFDGVLYSTPIAFSIADPSVVQNLFGGTVVNVEVLSFRGGSGNDVITGGALNDYIDGSEGNDRIDGGLGNDTLDGGGGTDTIYGGDGNDSIRGGAGNPSGDTLYGGADDDTLFWSSGDALLDGGTGVDLLRIDYAGSSIGLALDVSDPNVETMFLGTRLVGFERATVNAGDGGDHITGGIGDDSLTGNAGDDILIGGTGNDTLSGGDGADQLSGGDGDDYLFSYTNDANLADTFDGGAGYDRLEFQATNSTAAITIDLLATSGWVTNVEQITFRAFGTGTNHVSGGAFADTLWGGSGADYFDGRDGDDDIRANGGDDVVFGGGGNDYIEGGEGSNSLSGGDGDDFMRAGSGADTLDGGAGVDAMEGGAGDDIYIVDNAGDTVVEFVGGGNDTIKASVSYVLGAGVDVETTRLIGTANINLTGNVDHQILIGNSGNNTIDGGGGGDRMKGAAGDDTYIVRSSADTIVEVAGEGDDAVKAAISYALGAAAQVEHLYTIDALATTAIDLTGNDYSHDIQGNAGANTLTGGSGNDTINGNGGADTLVGGAGDDIYVVTDASTVIVESVGNGNDTIKAFVSYVLGAGVDVETTRLIGSANLDLAGNADHQILIGNSGNNIIDGGGGGDRMKGAAGDDTYIVRSAADTIVEIAGEGNDIVKAAVGYTLGAGAQVEHLLTIDVLATTAIDLTGNDYSHDIQGNAGANVLTAGSGDDVLQGLGGNDTLVGGGGADRFVFDHGTGQDSVGDFVSGTDKLDLSAFGFASFAAVQAATHDVGGNAVIDLGGGDSVTLTGVLTAQLQSGDVILGGGGSQTPLKAGMLDVQRWIATDDTGQVQTNAIAFHVLHQVGPTSLPALDYVF